jgi:hypothetical protein
LAVADIGDLSTAWILPWTTRFHGRNTVTETGITSVGETANLGVGEPKPVQLSGFWLHNQVQHLRREEEEEKEENEESIKQAT